MSNSPEFLPIGGEFELQSEILPETGNYLFENKNETAITPLFDRTKAEITEAYNQEVIRASIEKLMGYAASLDEARKFAIENQADLMLGDIRTQLGDTPIYRTLLRKFKELAPRLIMIHPAKVITERDLMSRESVIGGRAFGGSAEQDGFAFHYHQDKHWFFSRPINGMPDSHEVWHIEVESELIKTTVTRNHKDGAESDALRQVSPEENRIITFVAEKYHDEVMRSIYNRDPQTGKKLQ